MTAYMYFGKDVRLLPSTRSKPPNGDPFAAFDANTNSFGRYFHFLPMPAVLTDSLKSEKLIMRLSLNIH